MPKKRPTILVCVVLVMASLSSMLLANEDVRVPQSYQDKKGAIRARFSHAQVAVPRHLEAKAAVLGKSLPAAAVNVSDSLALVALYNSTNGASWTLNTNWLTTAPVSTWLGVLVAGDRVVAIDLSNNNLMGTLPVEIGDLTALEELLLYDNSIGGSIPTQIGSLPSLYDLDLYGNNLTGGIPAALGSLSTLNFLWLGDNQLGGAIPTELTQLSQLWELDLCQNQLTGTLPSTITNLSALEFLCVFDNELTGTIPSQLGDLGLEYLDLAENNFTGNIPTSFGNFTWMVYCDLSYNQLDGTIPIQLGSMTLIELLDIGGNRLTGTIPAGLGGLSWLNILGLQDNLLTGTIPENLGNPVFLAGLNLSNNRLEGNIPVSICNNQLLGLLLVNGNKLSGALPADVLNMKLIPDFNDFQYNALFSTNPTLVAFMNTLQDGGDWQSTQTVAPAGVSATPVNASSVQVSWTPILYTGDTGGYRVSYATTSGGPYTYFGMTADKSATSLTVTGLNPSTPYYFVVHTQTHVHANNQNIVLSDASGEATATTPLVNPEIGLFDAAANIPDGSTYDFGHQGVTRSQTRRLWIQNTGIDPLVLTTPFSITGTDPGDFGITVPPGATTLDPGDTTSFVVSFKPMVSGAKEALLQLVNNDQDENPFDIQLRGTGDKHSLTLKAEPPQGGTTTPSPGVYWFEHPGQMDITAVPALGWEFVYWEGYDIADSLAASTSIDIYWENHAIAHFRQVQGITVPRLAYHFPTDSALGIPMNGTLQFMTADTMHGINQSSLNAWINDTLFIANGLPVSDSTVVIDSVGEAIRVVFMPDSLGRNARFDVRVQFADVWGQVCDTAWTFETARAWLDSTARAERLVGHHGALFGDEALKMGLSIPLTAVTDSVVMGIGHAESVPNLPEGWFNIGLNYHLGPDGMAFPALAGPPWVTAAIPYTQDDLDAAGVAHPSELTVMQYSMITGEWGALPIAQVDETLQVLSVELAELGYLTYATQENSGVSGLERLDTFELYAPYPNPFNPGTEIHYRLSKSGPVEVKVFDLLGRKVRTLVNTRQLAGRYRVEWHGRDEAGEQAASGIYFIVLETEDGVRTQKVVLAR